MTKNTLDYNAYREWYKREGADAGKFYERDLPFEIIYGDAEWIYIYFTTSKGVDCAAHIPTQFLIVESVNE